MLRQLSKGHLSKETFFQGDFCPRDVCPRDFCPRRLFSKETFVQGLFVQGTFVPGDFWARRLLAKETFVQGDYCPSTNEYLTDRGVPIEKKNTLREEVSLDIKCPLTILDKSLLGQSKVAQEIYQKVLKFKTLPKYR